MTTDVMKTPHQFYTYILPIKALFFQIFNALSGKVIYSFINLSKIICKHKKKNEHVLRIPKHCCNCNHFETGSQILILHQKLFIIHNLTVKYFASLVNNL